MILKDKFYSIKSISENDGMLDSEIHINPTHEIFSGHFPGNPVTPGVVQIEIIKELLSFHFNRPLRLKYLDNCKFLAILNPNANLSVSVKLKFLPSDKDDIKISGTIYSDSIRFLQIQSAFH